MNKQLTPVDITRAAVALGISTAHVRAVAAVESKGHGFLTSGEPIILFERHKMYQALRDKFGSNQADAWATSAPDLVNPKSGGYGTTDSQHGRLDRAVKIDRNSALESASWGLFQVMGYHWRALNYGSLQDFITLMYRTEGDQLDAFVRYVRLDVRMVKALQTADWATFARLYNGPSYAANQYDIKLAAAYKQALHDEAVA